MDIAIKYEKINLGEEKYIFKPVSVIRGTYDMETDLFETEYGDLCVPIDGCMKDEDNYFGELTGIEKLSEYYPDYTEEEMLTEYYDLLRNVFYIAYYDYKEEKLELLKVPFETIENVLMNQKAKRNVNNKVKITVDEEKVKELRKIQNIKELHSKLDEILGYINAAKNGTSMSSKYQIKSKAATQNKVSIDKERSKTMTLKELRKEVKDVIKGQDKAVDDVTRAIVVNRLSSNPRHKSHMLIAGPSGTGKTEMINIITKKLGIPFFKADATAYTKEGYVGKSVYSMFDGLVAAANGDVKKAQKGILVIDEIDKKLSSREDDVGGTAVLNSLLKIMDREIIEVGDGNHKAPYLFDTSNLTIIFMGAFSGVYAKKEESRKKHIGFAGADEKDTEKTSTVITNKDLIDAGMPPEFLGRIPVVTNTEELSIDNLVEILYKSKGGAIDEEKEFCEALGVTIKFTSPYIREIAKIAHKTKTGARNLRKIVRESLSDAYDEILSGKEVKELKLTKKTALNSKDYYIK